MLNHERVAFAGSIPVERKNYFKAFGIVLTDTIANKVYGLEINRLSDLSKKESENYPRLSKAVEITTKYAFWIGVAEFGSIVSRHIGPEIGYTMTFAHPFVVGATVKAVNEKSFPIMEMRPSLPLFLATFGLMELAITPLFIGTINKIVHLSNHNVTTGLATASVAVGTLASLAVEYFGLSYIWKKFILRDIAKGDIKDEARGFMEELKPLSLFSSIRSKNPAENASRYFGQIYGIIESMYIWVQLAGVAVAVAAVNLHNVPPDDFINQFFQMSAQGGKKFLEAVALAKCCIAVENKIRENNESLRISSKFDHS